MSHHIWVRSLWAGRRVRMILLATVVWSFAAVPALAQDDLVAEAREALAQGNPAQAVELLSQALIHPDTRSDRYQSILIERGRAYAALGQADAALADLDEAVRRDNCKLEATVAMAEVALDIGHTPLALDLSGRAIRLAPDLGQGYRLRATVLEELGASDAAALDRTRANVLDDADRPPQAEQAWCLLAVREPGQALYVFNEIAAAGSNDAEALAVGNMLRVSTDLNESWNNLIALSNQAPESYASLWLALLAAPEDRDALLEERLHWDSLDIAAGLALVEGQIGRVADPFLSWRTIVGNRPQDGIMQELFALADQRPYDDEAAANLAATYLNMTEERGAFMPLRDFGVSLLLESEGHTELARELRKQTVFGRLPYGDGIVYLVAYIGYE